MAKLQQLIKAIEDNKKIGVFSKTNKTIGNGHTFDIPFALKPSQQLLAALGGHTDLRQGLLTEKNKIHTTDNADVCIRSFAPSIQKSEVTISGARIDRLFNSAHIYINTDLFPQIPSTKPKSLGATYNTIMNRSAALCHAQEIDLLVDTCVSSTGRAHTTVYPDKTSIQVDSPALLLLTTPSLDHSQKDLDTREKQIQFISAMYRNLFHAARTEGRMHMVMSAEGLGKQGRLPALYFDVLMGVAKEYPDLNIMYNAGTHGKEFDKSLKIAKNPDNVGRITKNIIFVAQQLINQGILCAIHNPSSIDVLYGLADVGEHWQSLSASCLGTNDPGKTMQSFLGTVSTAVLGSYGINPEAFDRIIERNLNPAMVHLENETSTVPAPETISTTKVIEEKKGIGTFDQEQNNASRNIEPVVAASAALERPIIIIPEELDAPSVLLELPLTPKCASSEPSPLVVGTPIINLAALSKTTAPVRSETPIVASVEPSAKTPVLLKEPPIASISNFATQVISLDISTELTKSDEPIQDHVIRPAKKQNLLISTSAGLFPLSPKKASAAQDRREHPKEKKSSLNREQLNEINKTIDRLVAEIQSCWPYPNKDLKQKKIDALNTLILNSWTMDLPKAIENVKSEYPNALDGRISTRTADLFRDLERACPVMHA